MSAAGSAAREDGAGDEEDGEEPRAVEDVEDDGDGEDVPEEDDNDEDHEDDDEHDARPDARRKRPRKTQQKDDDNDDDDDDDDDHEGSSCNEEDEETEGLRRDLEAAHAKIARLVEGCKQLAQQRDEAVLECKQVKLKAAAADKKSRKMQAAAETRIQDLRAQLGRLGDDGPCLAARQENPELMMTSWLALWSLRLQVERIVGLDNDEAPAKDAAAQLARAIAHSAATVCAAELGPSPQRRPKGAQRKAQNMAVTVLLRLAPSFGSSQVACGAWSSLAIMLAHPSRLGENFSVLVLHSLRASMEAAWDAGIRGRDIQAWARHFAMLAERLGEPRLCRRLQFAAIERRDWSTYGVLARSAPLDKRNILDETVHFLRSRAARQPTSAAANLGALVREQERLHEAMTAFADRLVGGLDAKRRLQSRAGQTDLLVALELLAAHMGAPWALERIVHDIFVPRLFDESAGPPLARVVADVCRAHVSQHRALVANIASAVRANLEAAPPQADALEAALRDLVDTLARDLRSPPPPAPPSRSEVGDHVIVSLQDPSVADDDDFLRANRGSAAPSASPPRRPQKRPLVASSSGSASRRPDVAAPAQPRAATSAQAAAPAAPPASRPGSPAVAEAAGRARAAAPASSASPAPRDRASSADSGLMARDGGARDAKRPRTASPPAPEAADAKAAEAGPPADADADPQRAEPPGTEVF